MSRNGSGTYNLPAGNPVSSGTVITSSWANTTLSDIATALTGSVASDGQTPMSGALNMTNNKIINLATGVASTDAANVAQVTSAVAITGGSIDGTTIGATVPSTGKFTTLEASSDVSFTGTSFLLIPSGTTAQRPVSPVNGEIRYNSTLGQFEGYANSAWGSLGGGATGGGADQIFVLNDQTVTVSYTIPTGKNASSAGPITIDTGVTVTIPTDSTWVIV